MYNILQVDHYGQLTNAEGVDVALGGFSERLVVRRIAPSLTVRYASRTDQIHLKLYAAVDHGGPGKHEQDLRALNPTPTELVSAARWSRMHDPSPGYRESLVLALQYFGVADVEL